VVHKVGLFEFNCAPEDLGWNRWRSQAIFLNRSCKNILSFRDNTDPDTPLATWQVSVYDPPAPRAEWGALAQLVERLVRNEKVSGSIPLCSIFPALDLGEEAAQPRPREALQQDAGQVREKRVDDHHDRRNGPGIPDQGQKDARDLCVVSGLAATGFGDEGPEVVGVFVLELALGKAVEPRGGVGEATFPSPDPEDGLVKFAALLPDSIPIEGSVRVEAGTLHFDKEPRDPEMDRGDADHV